MISAPFATRSPVCAPARRTHAISQPTGLVTAGRASPQRNMWRAGAHVLEGEIKQEGGLGGRGVGDESLGEGGVAHAQRVEVGRLLVHGVAQHKWQRRELAVGRPGAQPHVHREGDAEVVIEAVPGLPANTHARIGTVHPIRPAQQAGALRRQTGSVLSQSAAAAYRHVLGLGAEVPLSHRGSGVANAPQRGGEGGFVRRQPTHRLQKPAA